MITLKKVLAPTDFSRHSENALRYACALAAQFGADLHLLHVVQDVWAAMAEPGFAPPSGNWLEDLKNKRAVRAGETTRSSVDRETDHYPRSATRRAFPGDHPLRQRERC